MNDKTIVIIMLVIFVIVASAMVWQMCKEMRRQEEKIIKASVDKLVKNSINEVLGKIKDELNCEMIRCSGTGEKIIEAYVDGLETAVLIIDKYREVNE